ncbi:transcriptional regulator, LacI family [Haloechinothrix alba]|uniref:Transcriptional regulator, LacI family n=1 Tax=Haloechinothrix alba TaxID=664784 RepID=A0A238VQK6_9PSEU|nr:LacI family DNA-binding transcriptional regulator [Haloechinothrix alba]SNR36427.1 transcriptional regulator, LacI family [Haloechinothrix alba]
MARDERKRPTIYDVAREAELAPSTVSRALSNPGRVSSRTREHVLAVADRLGYQVNSLASALPSGRTHTVALFVSDITNPHFFGIIRGAEHQARAAGCTLILGDTEESPEVEARNIERLGSSVDGFVVAASRMTDEDIEALAGKHRVALISRQLAGLPSVIVDHVDGTREIVEHLAALGHESLVYLAGPRRAWLTDQRWRGLAQAARRVGMSARRLGPFQPTMRAGANAADVALGSGATAAVAHNDLMAIGMLRRVAERGMRVPDDLSVVGFDDIFGSDISSPALTTLGGPFEEVGRLAVDSLLGMREKSREAGRAEQIVLPSHLVIRGSTGKAPVR